MVVNSAGNSGNNTNNNITGIQSGVGSVAQG